VLGLGYLVAFIKVLTIYQMYHTWIHPLHHSIIPPLPGWNLSMASICIYF
jgi:hypothetical protein